MAIGFAVLALVAAQGVQVARVFPPGERLEYVVESRVQAERKWIGLKTFIPEDYGFEYRFTTAVQKVLEDGDAMVRYERPRLTEIIGETFERPEKRKTTQLDWKYDLRVSRINEVLESKDLTPKKAAKALGRGPIGAQPPAMVQQFVGEIYRLALFVGGLDSALDLSPKLPLDPVKPGDTWKRTASYAPQVIKGKDRQAVQRVDTVYTYRGQADSNGKRVQRITAALAIDTDIAPFVNQATGEETPELKSLKLTLKATVDFDLDPKTFRTLAALARSEGSITIHLRSAPDEPVLEERLKGQTTMTLVKAAP